MAGYDRYIISIIVLFKIGDAIGQQSCGMLDTKGYTIPHGDIVLRYGDPLNLTCNLHQKVVEKNGKNASSQLYFSRNHVPISHDRMDIVNSTSIRIHFENHPKTTGDNYYCYFTTFKGDEIICMNVVIVGVAPQNITDFSCISKNYDNLTCSWTLPENYVKTDYTLTYSLKGRASRKYSYNCPQLRESNGKMSCFWNVSTKPQYRQAHEMFYFRINMSNTFGSRVNSYTFEHFKNVLPNPPENLTAVATSPHSIRLSWVVPSSMVTFPSGLHHRILYQCEYYDKVWQFGGLITEFEKNASLTYELHGLNYAHALCDIRVSMRSAVADEENEKMWSENATITARTKSKVPDCPPKTDIGSFEVVSNHVGRETYVYWQQIGEEQKNGQNFSYRAEVENHPMTRPVELTKVYAMFQNLSVKDYVINIWSVNEEGRSKEKSTVVIPATRLSEPSHFIKIPHREDLYELRWEPSVEPSVTNYTIFWCSNEYDRPYQCVGDLNWTVVSKNTVKYNQSLPGNKIYQFAISANSLTSSSGMSWAECTVLPNRNLGIMKNFFIEHVSSNSIDVRWELECQNRISTITGFIIFYCPMESPLEKNCKNSTEKNVTISGNANLQSGSITGLKPYTTYRVTVGFIINHLTYSQPSEPRYNTTREAAPASPPLHIEVYNVTNSSIALRWQPPRKTNGRLKYYHISYNDEEKEVNRDQNETVLTDLLSYENYSIEIRACTIACSEPSKTIHVITKKWIPGRIAQPSIKSMNDSYTVIFWERPKLPRGEISYYQVQFTQKLNLENSTKIPYVNVTSQNYSVEGCGSGKYSEYYFSVRAVNIIGDEHKAGPWSEVLEFYCTQYTPLVYIVVSVVGIGLCLGVVWSLKKVYQYYQDMKKLLPKLPPGLEQGLTDHDLVPWSSENCSEGKSQIVPLVKINSFGGYVQADAVPTNNWAKPTSLPPGNYCVLGVDPSTKTDSEPSYVPLTDSIKSEEPPFTCNVTPPPPYVMTGDFTKKPNPGYVQPDAIPMTNWLKATSPPPGNYCVLGVDPSTKTENESSYVPLTDTTKTEAPQFTCDTSPPPPYVVTGDFTKTRSPNPGYVQPDAIPKTTWMKPTPPPPGNYCVLGVDPSIKTESQSSYVPLTDAAKLQLPFVHM